MGTIFDDNGQFLLIKIQEMTDKDDEEKINDFILECGKVIKEKYNVTIYGLTCVFDLKNLRDGYFFFVDLSISLEDIMKKIRGLEIFNQVLELLDDIKFFKEQITAISGVKILEIKENDLANDYNVLLSCVSNLKAIKQILIEHSSLFSENSIANLFKKDFDQEVAGLLNILKYIIDIINKKKYKLFNSGCCGKLAVNAG